MNSKHLLFCTFFALLLGLPALSKAQSAIGFKTNVIPLLDRQWGFELDWELGTKASVFVGMGHRSPEAGILGPDETEDAKLCQQREMDWYVGVRYFLLNTRRSQFAVKGLLNHTRSHFDEQICFPQLDLPYPVQETRYYGMNGLLSYTFLPHPMIALEVAAGLGFDYGVDFRNITSRFRGWKLPMQLNVAYRLPLKKP